MTHQEKVALIWRTAEILRNDYHQNEYGKVILPFTVLRRLDCVLEPTKDKVLKAFQNIPASYDDTMRDAKLSSVADNLGFYNTSPLTFAKMKNDPDGIAANLRSYIAGFSENIRDIYLDKFRFEEQISRLDSQNILFSVFQAFCDVDLHPDAADNHDMGYAFEELLRRFSEMANATAGEHFTPREVVRLMVNVLFNDDDNKDLVDKGIIRTLYDPTAGTGGMLSVASNTLYDLNPDATLEVFGQEINPDSYAVCKSDMLMRGQDIGHIAFGNSLTADAFRDNKFDYFLSNPPFGVEWKKSEREIKKEFQDLGSRGRFGAGLPRISDGALLFLQHMVSKFKPSGSRLAIVFNGSPLFTGSAGSGESEIRRWIIENDMLEAIIALPGSMFYNTGIPTFIWVVTNRKSDKRRGKVQLLNAVDFSEKMRKSLGDKRNEITEEQLREICRIYGDFKPSKHCKIFDNEDFGYFQVTIERPLVENGKVVKGRDGKPKADTSLRDTENVPLKESIKDYFEREVKPHVPDAWVDEDKTKIGYEIPFTRHFYEYSPPRDLDMINMEIRTLEDEIQGMLEEIAE